MVVPCPAMFASFPIPFLLLPAPPSPPHPRHPSPAELRSVLRPYQRRAVFWMLQRERGQAEVRGGRREVRGGERPPPPSHTTTTAITPHPTPLACRPACASSLHHQPTWAQGTSPDVVHATSPPHPPGLPDAYRARKPQLMYCLMYCTMYCLMYCLMYCTAPPPCPPGARHTRPSSVAAGAEQPRTPLLHQPVLRPDQRSPASSYGLHRPSYGLHGLSQGGLPGRGVWQ